MKYENREAANKFYKEVMFDAEEENCVKEVMADLGRRDLFFLLTIILNRIDANNDWLFERCKDVQNQPNEMLDLWAREHYKSTIITFAKSIQDIIDSHSKDSYWWKQEVTIGIFSHTKGIAKAFLKQIKSEFEDNQLLKDLYPDVLYQKPKKESPVWSLDNGIRVKRKGNQKEETVEAWGLVDGQPTSKHFLILNYDDVVTLESVSTPEQIKKTTDSLEMSYNLGVKEIGIKRFVGTRYHYHDSYAPLIKKGTVTPRIHPATDDGTPDGKPVFLSKKALAKIKRDSGSFVFSCQQLQDPKADEVQGFVEEDIQYWYPDNWGNMNRYILVDPASEKKKDSDYTVMAVVGLAEDKNLYLIAGVRDRLDLKERADWLFKLHRAYRPIKVGYEKYGQQADIEHMRFRMGLENYRFKVTPLGGAMAKNDRIRRLIPDFQAWRFYMPRKHVFKDYQGKAQDFTLVAKEELLDFPVAAHDDIWDCISRIKDDDFGAVYPEPKVKIPYDETNNSARMKKRLSA